MFEPEKYVIKKCTVIIFTTTKSYSQNKPKNKKKLNIETVLGHVVRDYVLVAFTGV